MRGLRAKKVPSTVTLAESSCDSPLTLSGFQFPVAELLMLHPVIDYSLRLRDTNVFFQMRIPASLSCYPELTRNEP